MWTLLSCEVIVSWLAWRETGAGWMMRGVEDGPLRERQNSPGNAGGSMLRPGSAWSWAWGAAAGSGSPGAGWWWDTEKNRPTRSWLTRRLRSHSWCWWGTAHVFIQTKPYDMLVWENHSCATDEKELVTPKTAHATDNRQRSCRCQPALRLSTASHPYLRK